MIVKVYISWSALYCLLLIQDHQERLKVMIRYLTSYSRCKSKLSWAGNYLPSDGWNLHLFVFEAGKLRKQWVQVASFHLGSERVAPDYLEGYSYC